MLKKEGVFISAILSLNKFRSLFTLEDSHYEAFFMADKPATTGEMLRRLSFSSEPQSPEEELLDTIRIGDALLNGLRNCEETVSSLREKAIALQKTLDEKSLRVSSLEKRMSAVEQSLFRKIAKYFYK